VIFTPSFISLGLNKVLHSKYWISFPEGISSQEAFILMVSKHLGRVLTDEEVSTLIREAKEYCEILKKQLIEEKRQEKLEIKKAEKRAEFEAKHSQIQNSLSVTGLDISLSNAVDSYAMSLVPISDYGSKKVEFFDAEKREIIDYDEEKYRAKKGMETRADLIRACFSGKIKFDPMNEKSIYVEEINGLKHQVFNKCNTPKWLSRVPTKDNIEGSLIHKLLLNLFPEKESRDVALSWAYHAYTSRNQTYLMLVGLQGVGKGLFTSLLTQLVGPKYAEVCPDSFLKDKFNGAMKDKRLLILDEIEIVEGVVGRLKQIANDFVPYEPKGIDSTTIRNYTSTCMTSNSIGDMAVSPQDRRFSAVSIGNLPLLTVMSQALVDELGEMVRRTQDEEPHEEIVNFCHWLLKEYKNTKYSNTYVHKGTHYYEMSFKGLKTFQQFLVTFITEDYNLSGDVNYLISDLNIKYKKYSGKGTRENYSLPNNKSMDSFLSTYKFMDKYYLGTLERLVDEKEDSSFKLVIDENLRQYLLSKRNIIDL
jgi:hypothetical protein